MVPISGCLRSGGAVRGLPLLRRQLRQLMPAIFALLTVVKLHTVHLMVEAHPKGSELHRRLERGRSRRSEKQHRCGGSGEGNRNECGTSPRRDHLAPSASWSYTLQNLPPTNEGVSSGTGPEVVYGSGTCLAVYNTNR